MTIFDSKNYQQILRTIILYINIYLFIYLYQYLKYIYIILFYAFYSKVWLDFNIRLRCERVLIPTLTINVQNNFESKIVAIIKEYNIIIIIILSNLRII